MRIVAGAWRGRALTAPRGQITRPTADRTRQALFDMLLHAEWGGRERIEGARVLDAFAGTGALGLEALSRGAAHATFMERDREALAALRANIAACRADSRCTVLAADVLAARPAPEPCALIFLDPPYGKGLLQAAVQRLHTAGWIAEGALIVAETGHGEETPGLPGLPLAERAYGAARISVWRSG
jgi:16S rRNA (guanine966-N2)-methyltransferase